MFGSNLLDVAIGMIFIYLLFSLITSAANEIIEGWLKNRASDLERGIREMLDPNSKVSKTGIVASIYSHPLVNGLYKGTYEQFAKCLDRKNGLLRWLACFLNGRKLPSYIPARNFAQALMDTVLPASSATSQVKPGTAPGTPDAPSTPNQIQELRDAIINNKEINDQTRNALLPLIDAAGNDIHKARENIEKWFNSAMDRVSGWYKRRTQLIIFCIGFAAVIALNADSIVLFNRLSSDKVMRESLVAAAEAYAKANNPSPAGSQPSQTQTVQKSDNSKVPQTKTPSEGCGKENSSPECKFAKTVQDIRKLEQQLAFPIGWTLSNPAQNLKNTGAVKSPDWKERILASVGNGWNQLSVHWLGWLISALAISLGAPFWFDMLSKFIGIRSTLKPQEKKQAVK